MADSLPAMNLGLIDVIAGVLAEHGPMTEDQLATALAGRGVDLGDAPDRTLSRALDDGDGLVAVLADQRWASLPALLTGRVFTHRVSGPELQHNLLLMGSDLAPVDVLSLREEYQRLTDGTPVVKILLPFDADILVDLVDDHGALELPPGYLQGKGLSEGDLITLGLAEDGLRLESVPAPVATAGTVAGLGQRLSTLLETQPGEPMSLEVAVWMACAEDPTLFTAPLPPLGEVLDTCGLAHDGEWLAPPGFDFPRWRVDQQCADIARGRDLSDGAAYAVLVLVTLYEQVAAAYDAALNTFPTTLNATTVRLTTVYLAEPAVAKAVLAETIGYSSSEGAAALILFAETLEPLVARPTHPALRWLRGKAHERLGDLTRAEAAFHAAESVNPQWSPVLVDLARYASDRGDATRGLALLRRAGTPGDHPLVELLEQFQNTPRLDERAAWLYQKASMFLRDSRWSGALFQAARVRAQFAEVIQAIFDAQRTPLVIDAVLFEGGAFAEFVATRGRLLPEDERLLAEQWLLINRSVYEIEQIQPGVGCTMRDVRTGDVHQVREQTVTAGALVCARVVPAGDTMQIFGGIEPVAQHERDELVELLDSGPDTLELVAFLTRRFAPPALPGHAPRQATTLRLR